jgi:hypothetical protein
LDEKIFKQLATTITTQRMIELNDQWAEAREKADAKTSPSRKKNQKSLTVQSTELPESAHYAMQQNYRNPI